MASNDDDLLAGITELAPRLLTTMEAFEQVQRNMHPSRLDQLAEFISPFSADLTQAFDTFPGARFPGAHRKSSASILTEATTYSLRACDGIINSGGDTLAAMKAHARTDPCTGKTLPNSQHPDTYQPILFWNCHNEMTKGFWRSST